MRLLVLVGHAYCSIGWCLTVIVDRYLSTRSERQDHMLTLNIKAREKANNMIPACNARNDSKGVRTFRRSMPVSER